jgi:hypothetical protein
MYELRLSTREIRGLELSPDSTYPSRTGFGGDLTILGTDSEQQRDRWLKELRAANVEPLYVTTKNVHPYNVDQILVKELGDRWAMALH